MIDIEKRSKALKLVSAIARDDFESMLREFPDGVTYRGEKYNKVEDFTEFTTFDSYVRFKMPIIRKLKVKCLERITRLLSDI